MLLSKVVLLPQLPSDRLRDSLSSVTASTDTSLPQFLSLHLTAGPFHFVTVIKNSSKCTHTHTNTCACMHTNTHKVLCTASSNCCIFFRFLFFFFAYIALGCTAHLNTNTIIASFRFSTFATTDLGTINQEEIEVLT